MCLPRGEVAFENGALCTPALQSPQPSIAKGKYEAWLLFFVSARHHHHLTAISTGLWQAQEPLPVGTVSVFNGDVTKFNDDVTKFNDDVTKGRSLSLPVGTVSVCQILYVHFGGDPPRFVGRVSLHCR